MTLHKDDVANIAQLARLTVNDDDVPGYVRELSNILSLVERMNGVDTSAIEPMAHPLDENQRLRPDEVTESDQREIYQECAPQIRDGLYLVPRVLE